MSKRFPIPQFDRDQYKNLSWSAPRLLTSEERAGLIGKARAGDTSVYGSYAVAADDAFYERFQVKGDHRHAVMCLLPPGPTRLVGRSWAWPLQRALVVDSLDAQKARVVHDWKTPRPMNTRLGPQDGVAVEGVVYALFGHRFGDHWIGNRTLARRAGEAPSNAFEVLSASDEANNDFHACNLSFAWA
jgi:hypothetical protein